MANYFNNFPLTFYTSGANNVTSLDTVTNIISRFSFQQSLKENTTSFYTYQIKDTDTPEIIASKFYDNPERHWIVLMFNDIIDPQYDWPLNYENFTAYVNSKYAAQGAANTTPQSGITWAQSVNNIHSYYKINTRIVISSPSDNKTIVEKVQLDANTYATVQESVSYYTLKNGTQIKETITKEKKTYYDYEDELNESKRNIKLIKPEFIPRIMEEFKTVINP